MTAAGDIALAAMANGGDIAFAAMSKRYGAATVVDDVSLRLRPGRVHALMGENGAGKSTLIKLIAGVVPADRMEVRVDGAPHALRGPQDAAALGFRFIHQELNTVRELSVAENILLGHDMPRRFWVLVDWRAMAARARVALDRLGAPHIDPRALAGELATGDRMLVSLAAALVPDARAPARLFVLDEPTAALQDAEVARLFAVIKGLTAAGAAVLYVSHRIPEIAQICDDVTVLRNGRHISTRPIAEATRARIIEDMTGTPVREAPAAPPAVPRRGAVVAQITDGAAPGLSGLKFALGEGEVIGVAGLAGAGQTGLLRLFLGEGRVAGVAQYAGGPLPRSPGEAWRRGVASVPQERRSEGLMMPMGARPNALLPHLSGVFARAGRERARVTSLGTAVSLKARSPDQPVAELSGGNQQKVVFARLLAGAPKLLLLEEPTRGVDVGARAEIHALIRRLVAGGAGALLATSDLPELLALSDRVLILDKGRQVGLLPAAQLTEGALLSKLAVAA
ncbi:MAG: sugar ABC transporter ATP-binding protein [Pseudomonadota bacterium]